MAIACAFVGRVSPPDGGRHAQSQMLLTPMQQDLNMQTTVRLVDDRTRVRMRLLSNNDRLSFFRTHSHQQRTLLVPNRVL